MVRAGSWDSRGSSLSEAEKKRIHDMIVKSALGDDDEYDRHTSRVIGKAVLMLAHARAALKKGHVATAKSLYNNMRKYLDDYGDGLVIFGMI